MSLSMLFSFLLEKIDFINLDEVGHLVPGGDHGGVLPPAGAQAEPGVLVLHLRGPADPRRGVELHTLGPGPDLLQVVLGDAAARHHDHRLAQLRHQPRDRVRALQRARAAAARQDALEAELRHDGGGLAEVPREVDGAVEGEADGGELGPGHRHQPRHSLAVHITWTSTSLLKVSRSRSLHTLGVEAAEHEADGPA